MFSPIWLIIFHRNALTSAKINGNLFIDIWNFTLEIRARALHNETIHEEGDPIETHTDRSVQAPIYDNCVELSIFDGKDFVSLKFSF